MSTILLLDYSIDTKLRAYLFEEKITLEGEKTGKSQQRLKLENNGRVFLIWPQTVCHVIDKNSPFFDMSARDLIQRRFEIVLSLTGNSRHTGQTTQSRTSYLSSEILWG
jgi:potassium inwardly-rectifying channel subfamily J, other